MGWKDGAPVDQPATSVPAWQQGKPLTQAQPSWQQGEPVLKSDVLKSEKLPPAQRDKAITDLFDPTNTIKAAPATTAAWQQGKAVIPTTVKASPTKAAEARPTALEEPSLEPLKELLPDDPKKQYATILPMAKDTATGKRSLAVPGILRDLIHAAEVPGKVTAGQATPEDMETAAGNLALGMAGLGKGVSTAPERVVSAAIKSGKEIIKGANHAAAYDSIGLEQGKAKLPEGFVTDKGRFISREEAAKLTKATGQVPQKTEALGKLHSEDVAKAAGTPPEKGTPQSRIFSPDPPMASTQNITTPRGIADRLYADLGKAKADPVELGRFLKENGAYNISPELDKKFGLHEDDPVAHPLNPEEQVAYERVIKPMRDEIEAAKSQLLKEGYDPEMFATEAEESGLKGGAIRQVKGKNTPMDRLMGTQERVPLKDRLKQAMTPVGKRSLSKSAGVVRPRSMFAMDIGGKRTVVYVDDGFAYDAANPKNLIGEVVDPDTREIKTPNGIGKLKDATRAEITAATDGRIQYHDQTTAVTATALLQVRRAARVAQSLEELSKAPEASEVMRTPAKGFKNIPEGWVEIPGVRAFRGKYFEPRFAEEIEDHLGASRRNMGELKALESLNRFAISSLFWLNPAHAYNVAEAFAVTKGALGFAKDLPGTAGDFVKSLKSVATRDKIYMQQVRAGVPMKGIDTATEKFSSDLLKSVAMRAAEDPKGFAAFASKFGKTPTELIKKIGQLSHDATFGLQDVLQQTLERGYARKGVGRATTTEQIAKTLPSYRTPARIAGSRLLGKAMKGSTWFQFPGWDVGRLQGLGNILKGSAKLDAKSLDQLLMIAVLYEFGKEVYDPAVKQITGNQGAEAPTSGYGVFPKAISDVYEGAKSVPQAAQSLFPLGYLPKAAAKFPIGVDLYTGQKISLPGEKPGEVAADYARAVARDIDPLRRLMDLQAGKGDLTSNIAGQIGFKVPTAEQQAGKAKAMKYNQQALKSKRKKEIKESTNPDELYKKAVKALNADSGN